MGIRPIATLRLGTSQKNRETIEKKNIQMERLAGNIKDHFWYRRKPSEGTRDPVKYELIKTMVIISKRGLPGRTV